MTNAEQFQFTVEAYTREPGGRAQQSEAYRVTAPTPEAAAAKALYEQLYPIGDVNRLRAKVWRMGPDQKPIVTLLYLKG